MKNANNKKKGLTKEEIAAMKDRIEELNSDSIEGEKVVLEKIAKMPEPDRSMGKRLHAVIMAAEPRFVPRLWYGMPAYTKNEKIICFFQNASKFKARYNTFGFTDKAKIDEGSMWPVYFAIKELTPAEEKRIAALVKKAVS